ncbi:hypothetical protein [Roseospira goensis]|uniref:Uncharacterized protein n=1 Tax=Roseospira goensis TaxID=391922 RepID=A0A7W6S199_9PROT|nr:hypothetical protein [Roseospira goensis]MBB4287014.1 hypothetical protein [Roseospira goensis]
MLTGKEYLFIELGAYALLAVYAIYRHRKLVQEVTGRAPAPAEAPVSDSTKPS